MLVPAAVPTIAVRGGAPDRAPELRRCGLGGCSYGSVRLVQFDWFCSSGSSS